MKLSLVIPAFNEEKLIRRCLKSARAALELRPGLAGEVIVCDNNSTDATAAIARAEGAEVVFEPHNQISRARNAGARRATGDWLLFIDADSVLDPGTLDELLAVIHAGRHAGGGCLIRFDHAPWGVRAFVGLWNAISRLRRWAAGSFLFCRADAFREVGGFSERVYAAEEILLSQELKRWARPRGLGFKILTRRPHLSSGRKASLYSTREMLSVFLSLALHPRLGLSERSRLPYLYDGRR